MMDKSKYEIYVNPTVNCQYPRRKLCILILQFLLSLMRHLLGILLILVANTCALHLPVKVAVVAASAWLSIVPPTPILPTSTLPTLLLSKDELPALDKCFGAVRKELSAEGESLKRLGKDIETGDFKDMILFTREYDAGFRGGVLKSAWKQLGPAKKRGIELSNSFTFDLIALNKAARNEDKAEASRCLGLVRQDLVDFLALESAASSQ